MSSRICSSLLSRFASNLARKCWSAGSATFHIEALESRIAPASTAAAILVAGLEESGVAEAEALQVSVTKGYSLSGDTETLADDETTVTLVVDPSFRTRHSVG